MSLLDQVSKIKTAVVVILTMILALRRSSYYIYNILEMIRFLIICGMELISLKDLIDGKTSNFEILFLL